jgi:hypothetical protein
MHALGWRLTRGARYKRPVLPRRVGLAFLAITTLLLIWNLWAFVRNQTGAEFTDEDKLAVRPRSIAAAAKLHSMGVVNTTFATYHSMRARLRGKHLLVPPDMAEHKFALERLARLTVEVSPTRLELPAAVTQRIFDEESNQLWALGDGTFTGAVIDPATERYALVWCYGDNGLQVLIPEDRYRRELAAIAGQR